MTRPTQLIIDLVALRHNVKFINQIAPGRSILAMVKANAYGHGLERIAQALPQVAAFGVACLEEGLRLRAAGIVQPIVLMEGLFAATELTTAVANNFSLVVHHDAQVAMLEQCATIKPLFVWLKINTGMNRLGFNPSVIKHVYQRLMQCPAVQQPIGMMTHFAAADKVDQSLTQEQITLFNTLTADHNGPKSLANSAAIMAWPAAHGDWIRPGIMLYGTSPFSSHHPALKPVMTLQSALIAMQWVAKGSPIGYGGWRCSQDTRIGIVGVGYGDGYPQYAQQGTPVLVNGKPCALLGRVSMDMLAVDLNGQPDAQLGDSVTLWGQGLPIETIAAHSGTSAYEIMLHAAQRIPVKIVAE